METGIWAAIAGLSALGLFLARRLLSTPDEKRKVDRYKAEKYAEGKLLEIKDRIKRRRKEFHGKK